MFCLGNSVCLNLICYSDGGGIALGFDSVKYYLTFRDKFG